jgi:hypothetical protein
MVPPPIIFLCFFSRDRVREKHKVTHGRATEEGRRTGIPASTLWVSAAGKRPRTQQHMAQLKMSLVYLLKEENIWFLYMLLYH